MQENEKITEEEFEFDDSEFEDIDKTHKIKHGQKKISAHTIFFIVIGCLFLFAVIRLAIWNIGKDSGYDPTEDTSEFDTEPLDYIQPLEKSQLDGKPVDDTLTILCLGNAPFADDGMNNPLAFYLSQTMDATCINASFADSFQSQKNADYSGDYPADGISLYQVTKALTSGDFSTVKEASKKISEEASKKASSLESIDMSTLDCVVIMYDLSDYMDLRPAFDPGNADNLVTYCGALNASINLIQEKYPYIRIVVLSTPASGKTVDDFYIDGDKQDMGNGTLVDYMGHEVNTAISNGVSYIDTYFGVINVENRVDLLKDEYHLNDEGAKAVADRFAKLITLTK